MNIIINTKKKCLRFIVLTFSSSKTALFFRFMPNKAAFPSQMFKRTKSPLPRKFLQNICNKMEVAAISGRHCSFVSKSMQTKWNKLCHVVLCLDAGLGTQLCETPVGGNFDDRLWLRHFRMIKPTFKKALRNISC